MDTPSPISQTMSEPMDSTAEEPPPGLSSGKQRPKKQERTKQPKCRYGAECYDARPEHRRRFAHDAPPAAPEGETECLEEAEEEESGEECVICCGRSPVMAVGRCGHRDVCYLCIARMRHLYKDWACPICKTECDRIIFTKDPTATFESFQDRPISFPDMNVVADGEDVRLLVAHLFVVQCTPCSSKGMGSHMPMAALRRHLRKQHNMQFCDLCLRHRKVFLHEQALYTKGELRKHLQEGGGSRFDPELFRGHPMCKFCGVQLFSNDELWTHLRDKHHSCPVCDREDDEQRRQYFSSMRHLRDHAKEYHYPCEHPACAQLEGAIFATDIDLHAHQVSEHKMRRGGQKIQLGFTVGGSRSRGSRGGRGRGQSRRARVTVRFVVLCIKCAQRSPSPEPKPVPPPLSPLLQTSTEKPTPSPTPPEGPQPTDPTPVTSWVVGHRPRGALHRVEQSIVSVIPRGPVVDQPTPSVDDTMVFPKVSLSIPRSRAEQVQRNKALARAMRDALQNDHAAFSDFRVLSQQYRRHGIEASYYLAAFAGLFGAQHAPTFFGELVSLLPDASQRRELLKEARSFNAKVLGKEEEEEEMFSCDLCGQVMPQAQSTAHVKTHDVRVTTTTKLGDEKEYPLLPGASTGPVVTPANSFAQSARRQARPSRSTLADPSSFPSLPTPVVPPPVDSHEAQVQFERDMEKAMALSRDQAGIKSGKGGAQQSGKAKKGRGRKKEVLFKFGGR